SNEATTTTTLPKSRFLDSAAMSAMRHMRFAPRGQIEGAYSGRHRSRKRGGASEFTDYREYAPGEDLRRLDWKVLARTGRPMIRFYQDETNLVCTIALDASGSMRFNGHRGAGAKGLTSPPGSKLEYAQYLAT